MSLPETHERGIEGRRQIAPRLSGLRPSASLEMGKLARDLRQRGIDVVDLTTGEPDFPTPTHVRAAAVECLFEEKTHYTPVRGFPELLEELAQHLARAGQPHYDPTSEILVTPGATHALFETLLVLVGPEDEVVCPSPCWLSYEEITAIAGGRLVHVPGEESDGFIPTMEACERAISPQTKVLLLNNPANPTGSLWTRDQLKAALDLAVAHDLWVVADEVYGAIVFDDQQFVPFSTLPGARDRTITIGSFSKVYAMTGWRVGYLAGPESVVRPISLIHQHSAHCAPSVSQMAALAALRGSQSCVQEMVKEYQARRDLLMRGLGEIPEIKVNPVRGTFYAFLNTRSIRESSVEVARLFLEEAHVAMTPGRAYGEAGEGHLRVSFATSRDNLRHATERIAGLMSRMRTRGQGQRVKADTIDHATREFKPKSQSVTAPASQGSAPQPGSPVSVKKVT